ncbi:NeuD/PglB/VioB family sugar acetyltransferase [Adhaeribacter radiodurans]|uniref:NeuD/PglB/VioB family sugar acetyltransferase n=1 Tax=Adhaeribacter radiodurans TaxID=2745197 RepID=A0A7L7LCG3_9BACT|nr:NeuD/PglB/VioB family sugar acetyltransferase [Adhaeribacter radiodurans]QMU30059.1 NeuD/PglB/VioB family sugar acetyltransferase [Adhaeribacter radiodurans]
MENPVIILGAQKLGVVALDIFQSNNVIVYCFLDDEVKLHQTEVNGITIMGTTDDPEFLKILGKKCEVFVAAEETATRKSLINLLKEEYQAIPVNAIHKFTSVSEHAWLGHGNLINAGVVINANARINNNCIINSNALVDSGAQIADFVQIGAGAIISADVEVEESAFIGAGAVVVAGIKIGKKGRVGAGAVVVANVPANQTVFGNPAQKV